MKRRWLCLFLTVAILISALSGLSLRAGAAENMTTSRQMIDVIKYMEGFARRAYWDNSQWTVGYGTRCPNEMLEEYDAETGRDITVEEAEALLRAMMVDFENSVNALIRRYGLALTQQEFDALVSFTYNCGGAWAGNSDSALNMAVRSGATGTDLVYAMSLYSLVNTDYDLIQRRLCEARTYLEGVYKAYNDYSEGSPVKYNYVFLDGNGGEVQYDIHGYDGADAKAPRVIFRSIPTGVDAEGKPFLYTFAGWYTTATGGTRVDVLDGSLPSGTVLYAQWADPTGQIVSLPKGQPVENVTATALSKVYARTGPGSFYPKTSQLAAGTLLTVTQIYHDDSLTWGLCQEGWVCLNYTDYQAPDAPTVETPAVTAVTLLKAPDRTEYVQMRGVLDLQGSLIQIQYSDGSIGGRTLSMDMITSFNNERLGQTTVTASYGGCEVTFPVNVVPATVTFCLEDGTVLSQKQYNWGETVAVPGDPAKPADENGEYYFAGWSPMVTTCNGDEVYTAVFHRTGETEPTQPETTAPTQPDPTDATQPAPTDPQPTEPEPTEPEPTEPEWPRFAIVTEDDVNVRTGAGTAHDVAGYRLNTGNLVQVHQVVFDGAGYNWGRLTDGNWICMDYIKLLSIETDALPGDMNADGTVNKDDAIYLLRHVVFPDKYPIVNNGDTNSDGTVNKDDAIYLLRHVVFPDKYPLND